MKQFSVAVNKIEDGILHVRSAGLIMKEASQFASDVKVTKDEKTVNGKDIQNEKVLEEKRRMEQMPKGNIHERTDRGRKNINGSGR